MSRNDSGTTPAETVVAMAISGMLFASVIGMMFLSVKLVRTAPPDTNPHTFGALATSLARLEGSLAAPQSCENPPGEHSRSGCLKVVVGPAAPQAHVGHGTCWVVATSDGRRLECWEHLEQGDLVAYRYLPVITQPQPGTTPTTCIEGLAKDCLYFPMWQSTIDKSGLVAHGLAQVIWNTTNVPWTLTGCAAIRPDQRRSMDADDVPFCDGAVGVFRDDGRPRSGPEGYPMPTLRIGL